MDFIDIIIFAIIAFLCYSALRDTWSSNHSSSSNDCQSSKPKSPQQTTYTYTATTNKSTSTT